MFSSVADRSRISATLYLASRQPQGTCYLPSQDPLHPFPLSCVISVIQVPSLITLHNSVTREMVVRRSIVTSQLYNHALMVVLNKVISVYS